MRSIGSIFPRRDDALRDVPPIHGTLLPGLDLLRRGSEALQAKSMAIKSVARGISLRATVSGLNQLFALDSHIPSNEPSRSLSPIKLGIAGEVGAAVCELAGERGERLRSQKIAIQICQIVSITDFFVDEVNGDVNQKFRIIDKMQNAIERGEKSKVDYVQLDRALDSACDLHRQFRKSVRPEILAAAFRDLGEAAKVQLSGPHGLGVTAAIGGGSFSLFPAAASSFGLNVSKQRAQAIRHLGAFIQMLDDIHDSPQDLALGTFTAVTSSSELAACITQVKQAAREQFKSGLALLDGHDRVLYRAIGELAFLRYRGASQWSLFESWCS